MAQDSVEEAEKQLEENGCPCIRVRTIKELADDDPHIRAREMMVEVEQPFIGKVKMYGSPLKFSETPVGVRGHAPLLGEHNEDVLVDLLGYSQGALKELYESGVLHQEPAVKRFKALRWT